MAFSAEELRALLFDYIREAMNSKTELLQLSPSTIRRIEHTIAEREGRQPEWTRGDTQFLDEADRRLLKQLIWDLILERVLLPGVDAPNSNEGWPFFHPTEHGKKVLSETRPVPYDPDGYLKQVHSDSPNLHSTVLRYVQESVATFRSGNYLASVVMLGAASERLFDDIGDSITTAIADLTKQESFKKQMAKRDLAPRIRAIIMWCQQHHAQLDTPWDDKHQSDDINQIASFIRNRRNDAGHPQDPPAEPTHEQMYAWLMVFPQYCKTLSQLKDYLAAHPASIT